MSNQISTQQTVTSVVDGVRTVLSSNQNTYTTSSNFIAGGQVVTSASWASISLGGLSDVRILTVTNDNTVYTASSIYVATGSTGGNIIAKLGPGDQMTTPWLGSYTSLYARVMDSYPTGATLPTTGSIQWLVQQS
jgi:hypothetical protein